MNKDSNIFIASDDLSEYIPEVLAFKDRLKTKAASVSDKEVLSEINKSRKALGMPLILTYED